MSKSEYAVTIGHLHIPVHIQCVVTWHLVDAQTAVLVCTDPSVPVHIKCKWKTCRRKIRQIDTDAISRQIANNCSIGSTSDQKSITCSCSTIRDTGSQEDVVRTACNTRSASNIDVRGSTVQGVGSNRNTV